VSVKDRTVLRSRDAPMKRYTFQDITRRGIHLGQTSGFFRRCTRGSAAGRRKWYDNRDQSGVTNFHTRQFQRRRARRLRPPKPAI